MTTIGLFSGTFDPIHIGHIQLAQAALNQLKLEEVWVLVSADPPRKQPIASFAQRLEMVRLATQNTVGIIADREPIQRQSQHHSLAMARQLKTAYPDVNFTLIMGEDVFAGVSRWDGISELQQLLSFAVAKRGSEAIAGPTHVEIDMDHMDVSSTKLKLRLQSGDENIDLSPPVASYIKEHRLYV